MENHCLFEFDEEVTESTNLFKEGYLDSFAFVELIMFLESNFSVKFQSSDLLANKFCSVNEIIKSLKDKGVNGD